MNEVVRQDIDVRVIPKEQRVFFRNSFRSARNIANQDAEGFQEILFVLERFGGFLSEKILDLGKYETYIGPHVSNSPLFSDIPVKWRDFHLPFTILYGLVRNARNDALHQGAYARHLTNHAIQLSLLVEDALAEGNTMVSDFMVHDVVSAKLWQPVSFIRQQMLANSFSYLPIETGEGWKLVSDAALVDYLGTDRKERLAKKLEDAINIGLVLDDANTCEPSQEVEEVIPKLCGKPILVVNRGEKHLLGIVTPFDLL